MLERIFGMSLKDKATFFRQLATLIESGMTLMGCLEALAAMPNDKVRRIIKRITPMIQEGRSLSESLATFPEYFDDMTLMMIRAGEVGGQLEIRLNNIANYMERLYNLQQKTISKFVYPVILIHCGIFIPPLVLLITQGPMAYFKATLIPLFLMYAVVIGSVVGYRTFATIPGMKEMMDSIFLYFPILGIFFRVRSVYRFILVLADLTDAGLNLDLAIKTAAFACGNAAAAQRFLKAIPAIEAGRPLSYALRVTGLFPEMTLQMIHTGEEAGSLPKMLGKSAEILGQNLEETQNRVFAIIPIVFYLAIAAYVGYTVIKTFVGIYAPLMELYPK